MDPQNPPIQNLAPTAPGDARQQIIDNLKKSNNVLVTVSANPSVDQLAAAIGLTLMLHKLNKHATAVFSGEVPSTIEFLQPEETLEKNTDSLRDFIIALDRSKADKLRYKVEDKVVKIFITPYRTSITDKDLDFSQGDFNVDVVVALGVRDQADLDQAITAHGRILHDATVTTISTADPSTLGSINWQMPTASSLSEAIAGINKDLGSDILDEQISTALLTGIVAETERFSNDKTTPQTMSISAQLMSAGANQQLVATKLEPVPEPPTPVPAPPAEVPVEPAPVEPAPPLPAPTQTTPDQPPAGPSEEPAPIEDETATNDDGALKVPHEGDGQTDVAALPEEIEKDILANQQIDIDDKGKIHRLLEQQEAAKAASAQPPADPASAVSEGSRMIVQPPTFGGTLTAETTPEAQDPSTDGMGMSLPKVQDLLQHSDSSLAGQTGSPTDASSPASSDRTTLSQLENSVGSSKTASEDTAPSLDGLRQQVDAAAVSAPSTAPLPPISALNALPGLENINQPPASSDSSSPDDESATTDNPVPPPVPPPLPLP